jgi:hypothetical protein
VDLTALLDHQEFHQVPKRLAALDTVLETIRTVTLVDSAISVIQPMAAAEPVVLPV